MIKRIFNFLILALVLFATHSFWMPYVGTVLTVPDKIQKSDCVFVLRGDDYFRFEMAAQLHKDGWAPWVMTSVTPADINVYDLDRKITGMDKLTNREIVKKYFEYFGLPPEKIIFTGYETTSTYEEALEARSLFARNKFKSMILVTSGYHMRRALWIFKTVLKDTGIQIHPMTAGGDYYQPKSWWKKERDVRAVEAEYGAFVFNFFYHYLLKKHDTSFDTA